MKRQKNLRWSWLLEVNKEEKQPKTGPLNFADELSSKLGLSVAPKLRNSDVKMDEDSDVVLYIYCT